MKVAIYTVADGKIVRKMDIPPCDVERQCRPGEDFFLNCPDCATHIIGSEPAHIESSAPSEMELLSDIRAQRNQLLAASDFRMLPDYSISEESREQWRIYRQALRDLPESCDPSCPLWPTPPSAP